MRLAAISDIHGNIAALEAVLDDIARRDIDLVVNLGDCLSGPFDAVATAERLMALDLVTVRGNHDRMLFDGTAGLWESWIADDLSNRHLDWIRSLPEVARIDDVFLCHATPSSDDENWLDHRGPDRRLIARDLQEIELRAAGVDYPVMLCGHTHTPRTVRLPDGRRIVNPGAVGCPAYLDTRSEMPFIHQTGSPDARYAVLEQVEADWRIDLVSVPYDARAMVRLAEARGADSWARAITTGWFA
ncbi:MAG: metallophosphoesterase [Rhodobacteraceae bacterium]|nr:MAG: metallophosphoesterase [Paracoccaceae bacterium]